MEGVNRRNELGKSPLHMAVFNNKSATVVQLLSFKQIDVNNKTKEGEGSESLGDNFLLSHVSFFFPGDSALHLACWRGHLDCTDILLSDKRVDVNLRNSQVFNSLFLLG